MADSVSSHPREHGTWPLWPAVSPRTASRALYGSLLTLALSMVAISLFFAGAGGFWGPVNDVLVAASVLLLVPAIVAVRQLSLGHTGAWTTVLSAAAIAGVLLTFAGQVALVIGIIELETSFVTGSVGVLMVIAWLACTAVLALRMRILASAVGWWASAFLIAVLLTTAGIGVLSMDTPTLTLLFGVPLLITLGGWMLSLARDLGRRPAQR